MPRHQKPDEPQQKREAPVVRPVPLMQQPTKLIGLMQFAFNKKVQEFLVEDNEDFLVVGCIGGRGCGKSTILNLLADSDSKFLQKRNGKFTLNPEEAPLQAQRTITDGMDLFVTKERLFLIDTAPLFCSDGKRESINSEMDDLRLVTLLLAICHVVVVVQDDYANMNLVR